MELEYGTQIVLAIISSNALSALISGGIALFSQRRKKKDSNTAGLRILLYDRIKHLAKSYISRGWITTEELEDLMEMHKVYHDLGGNGYLDALMDQVHRLTVRAS